MSKTDTEKEIPGQEETEPDAAPAEPAAKDPLAVALKEAAHWKEVAARNQADLENYRKRVARERDEDMKRVKGGLLEDLLPVLDNFELGMIEVRKADPKSPIVVGMEMIERQIREFIAGAGIEEIRAAGADFDPNLHEAVSQEANADVPEGKIIRELRKGYKLRDRLLRATMAVVSKGKA